MICLLMFALDLFVSLWNIAEHFHSFKNFWVWIAVCIKIRVHTIEAPQNAALFFLYFVAGVPSSTRFHL